MADDVVGPDATTAGGRSTSCFTSRRRTRSDQGKAYCSVELIWRDCEPLHSRISGFPCQLFGLAAGRQRSILCLQLAGSWHSAALAHGLVSSHGIEQRSSTPHAPGVILRAALSPGRRRAQYMSLPVRRREGQLCARAHCVEIVLGSRSDGPGSFSCWRPAGWPVMVAGRRAAPTRRSRAGTSAERLDGLPALRRSVEASLLERFRPSSVARRPSPLTQSRSRRYAGGRQLRNQAIARRTPQPARSYGDGMQTPTRTRA